MYYQMLRMNLFKVFKFLFNPLDNIKFIFQESILEFSKLHNIYNYNRFYKTFRVFNIDLKKREREKSLKRKQNNYSHVCQ